MPLSPLASCCSKEVYASLMLVIATQPRSPLGRATTSSKSRTSATHPSTSIPLAATYATTKQKQIMPNTTQHWMDTNYLGGNASEPEISQLVEKCNFYQHHLCIWHPRWERSHQNFIKIFCIIKLEFPGYCVTLFFGDPMILWCSATLVQHQLVADRQTDKTDITTCLDSVTHDHKYPQHVSHCLHAVSSLPRNNPVRQPDSGANVPSTWMHGQHDLDSIYHASKA